MAPSLSIGAYMQPLYGILKTSFNSGLASELAAVFAAPLNIVSNQPSFVNDTLSLRRRTASQGVQRWEIETNIAPTNNSASFFLNNIVSGHVDKMYVRMPQIPGITRLKGGPDEAENLNVTLVNNAAKGAVLFNVTGLSGNNFGAGEFIKFETDSKIYVIVDPGVDGLNVQLHPPLRANVPIGTKVWYGSKVTLTARYDPDIALGLKFIDGILADPGTIKLVEAL